MLCDLQKLRAQLGDEVYSLGQRLVDSGAVAELRERSAGSIVTAVVQAPELGPQRVYVRLAESEVDGECSCATGLNCAHVAAALIAAEQQRSAESGNDATPSSTAYRQRPSPLTAASAIAAQQRLVYLLEPTPLHQHCIVSACSVRLQLLIVATNGGGASPRNVPKAQAYLPKYSRSGHYPRYVADSDKAVLKQLAVFRDTPKVCDPRGKAGATLIQLCVATGRCYWGDLEGETLKPGAALTAQPCWQVARDGSQQLYPAQHAEKVIIAVDPPLYFDAENRCCGEWRLPLSAALLDRILNSPAVQPEQVAAFNRQLLAQDRIHIACVPELRPKTVPVASLAAALLLASAGGVDRARLQFVYNGIACEEGELPAGQDWFRYLQNNELHQLQRDLAGEATLQKRLAEFFPLQRRSTEQRGSRAVVRQALLRDELTLPTERDWLTFMLEGVPALQQEGWDIRVDDSFRYRLSGGERWYGAMLTDALTDAASTDSPAGDDDWFNLELGIMVGGEAVNLLPLLVEQLKRVRPLTGSATEIAAAANLPPERQFGEDYLFELPDGDGFLPVPLTQLQTILNTLLELIDGGKLSGQQYLPLPLSQVSRLEQLAKELVGGDSAHSDAFAWRGDEALQALALRLRNFDGITPLVPPPSFRTELRPYQQEGLGWLQFLRRYEFSGVLADDMGLGKTVQTLAHLALEKAAGRLQTPSLLVAPTSLIANWRREAERFAPGLRVLAWHGANRKRQEGRLADADLILTSYPLLNIDAEILQARHYYLLILDEAQVIKNPRAKVTRRIKGLRAEHRLCLTGTPMENHLGELWSLFDFLMPGFLGKERQFQRLYRAPIEKMQDGDRHQALLKRIAPFMLRRSKAAVAADLPAKTEIIRRVALAEEQRHLYDAIRVSTHRQISKVIAAQGFARSQIEILDALLKLRQVCCDPRLLKLEAALAVQESAKFELLMSMLPELVAEGRCILLFSQFTAMLRLIEAAVVVAGIDYVSLTGNTRDRVAPVDRFQSGAVPLFLISLKAGGTGLNLTAADTVIHYDPWWNPAVATQATDRAHRIGQNKQVFVYKLIVENSVEEKILELQAQKQALADGIYSGRSLAPTELRPEDLDVLFEAPTDVLLENKKEGHDTIL